MAQLNFDSAETTSGVEIYSGAAQAGMVGGLLLLWVVLVAVSAWLSASYLKTHSSSLPRLSALPGPAKLLALLVVINLLIVQVVAGAAAYAQTQVVNASVVEYFQYLSAPRLLGISHAHIFGYTMVYGLLSFLVLLSNASERTKAILVSVFLWSGTVDVASWWGIKLFCASFHWVSVLTGTAIGMATLWALLLMAQSIVHVNDTANSEK